jgi:hypothetical protein
LKKILVRVFAVASSFLAEALETPSDLNQIHFRENDMKRCELRLLRKTCIICCERQAHFRYAGRVKWDRQHDLCFQCFRSVRERARSLGLARQRIVWPIPETTHVPVLSMVASLTFPGAPSSNLLGASANLEPQSARLPDEPSRELQSANLRTVTVHLPLIHNPNKLGLRMPIWFGKIWKTLHEIQARFSGLKVSLGLGWCAEDRTWDPHLCVDFDTQITSESERYLTWWNGVLRDRFRQRAVYMKLSGPVRWM